MTTMYEFWVEPEIAIVWWSPMSWWLRLWHHSHWHVMYSRRSDDVLLRGTDPLVYSHASDRYCYWQSTHRTRRAAKQAANAAAHAAQPQEHMDGD